MSLKLVTIERRLDDRATKSLRRVSDRVTSKRHKSLKRLVHRHSQTTDPTGGHGHKHGPGNLAQDKERRSDGRRVLDAHHLNASIVRGGQITQGVFDRFYLWANTRGTTNIARTPKSGFPSRLAGLNKPIPHDLKLVLRATSGIAPRVCPKRLPTAWKSCTCHRGTEP